MAEKDYALGTHDAEIARLGLQHRVWRSRTLAAWHEAGFTVGQSLLDLGCGPGYATLDLAEIVGPDGMVIAVERSQRFLDALQKAASTRGLGNIRMIEQDVTELDLGHATLDGAWCRWLLSFVHDPQTVVRHLRTGLKRGAAAVFFEYVNYRSWRFGPHLAAHEQFVAAVEQHWRAEGGEPDIGLALPALLAHNGFQVERLRAHVEAVRPGDYFWEWPKTFLRVGAEHMVERGRLDATVARQLDDALAAAESDPGAFVLTPVVLEVIARAV
ncbi:MAG: methyltransferase domain-containing protein [Steroidobacteraceae bacterium]